MRARSVFLWLQFFTHVPEQFCFRDHLKGILRKLRCFVQVPPLYWIANHLASCRMYSASSSACSGSRITGLEGSETIDGHSRAIFSALLYTASGLKWRAMKAQTCWIRSAQDKQQRRVSGAKKLKIHPRRSFFLDSRTFHFDSDLTSLSQKLVLNISPASASYTHVVSQRCNGTTCENLFHFPNAKKSWADWAQIKKKEKDTPDR